MKIVDRKAFLGMPANTLFSKWELCYFGALTIKGETCGSDFLMQEIADAVKCDDSDEFVTLCNCAASTGASLALDLDCIGRDGCFDADQLFAVWEADDVLALIERLKACVTNTKDHRTE